MSSAASPELTLSTITGRYHFALRRLHSLTGLAFGGYLIVHLLVNATIAQGGVVYQQQVDKINSLPFLRVVEWSLIYIPILFHTAYGIWILLTGQPNVNHYPYAKNWFYVLQRISAIIIVVFMLFHVLTLKYGLFGFNYKFYPEHALGTVGRHLQMPHHWFIVCFVYPVGILASCYHLANGFWTAAITWGLTVSACAQRRWGYMCAGLFAVLFIAGMTALIAGANLDWNKLVETQQAVGHGP